MRYQSQVHCMALFPDGGNSMKTEGVGSGDVANMHGRMWQRESDRVTDAGVLLDDGTWLSADYDSGPSAP